MNMLEKLDHLMEIRSMNKSTLSNMSGVPYTTIDAFYKKGYENAKISTLKKIATAMNVTLDYLVRDEINDIDFGKTSDFLVTQAEVFHITKYRTLDYLAKDIVDILIDKEYEAQKERIKDLDSEVDIIVYDFPAAAGIPVFAEDAYTRIKYKTSDIPKGADFGIRITGDSMEPTINDGDIVFVHKTSSLKNNEIGIFMLDVSEAVCKRYLKNGKAVELHSDNPAYSPLILKPHQQLGIVGKVLLYK